MAKANSTTIKTATAAASTGAETIVATKGETKAEVIQTATAVPKTHKANAVFKELFAAPAPVARKDMIAAAMKEAGISKDCAATYLQNYKRKNGLQKTAAKVDGAPQA